MTSRHPTPAESQFADRMARASAQIYSGIVGWYVDAFFDDLSDADWLEELSAAVPPRSVVLDSGAGPGNFAQFLVMNGLTVISSDISFGMTEMSQRLVPQAPVMASDMRAIPARSRAFDAVLCAYSLMHVPAPLDELVLVEFARVIRQGGVLQLMVKVGDSAHPFRARGVEGVAGHVQLFNRDRLVHTLRRVGFDPFSERMKSPASPAEFAYPKLMVLARRNATPTSKRSR